MLMRIHIIDAPNLGENPTAKRLIAQYEMLLKQLQQYTREHHDAIEIIPPPSLSDEWDEL